MLAAPAPAAIRMLAFLRDFVPRKGTALRCAGHAFFDPQLSHPLPTTPRAMCKMLRTNSAPIHASNM